MSGGDALQDELASLRELGADQCAPVQFRYIEALLRRGATLPDKERENVERKAAQALLECRASFQRQRQHSNDVGNPGRSTESLVARLSALTEQLAHRDPDPGTPVSFAACLRKQERDLLHSAKTPELRAGRRLRDASARRQAVKVLAQARRQTPSEPGPLNPQRLAADSMAAMGALSPSYLNRFVAYIDTLQWLEQSLD
jgi:hypothetical protein